MKICRGLSTLKHNISGPGQEVCITGYEASLRPCRQTTKTMVKGFMPDRKRPHSSRHRHSARDRPEPATKGRNRHRHAGAPVKGAPGKTLWLYGVHAVIAALENPARVCHRLLVSPRAAKAHGDRIAAATATARAASAQRPDPETTDIQELDRILVDGTVHQGLVLLVDPLEAASLEDMLFQLDNKAPALIVVIDQGTDPQNIGAVIRSAAAFGATALLMQDRHAPEAIGSVAKVASGALERLPIIRVTNLARAIWQLKDAAFWCIGLDGEGDQDLDAIDVADRVALVLGAESKGLRRLTRETCDQLARIPISEGSGSLNLSNAAAIGLYAVTRRRN